MAKRLTEYEKQLRAITEREWQSKVVRIAILNGWHYYHPPDNKPINGRIQKVVSGFPDLTLVRDGKIIFAELKRETGRLSDEQILWLDELQKCNIDCYVWRPSDIEKVVTILAKKQTAT